MRILGLILGLVTSVLPQQFVPSANAQVISSVNGLFINSAGAQNLLDTDYASILDSTLPLAMPYGASVQLQGVTVAETLSQVDFRVENNRALLAFTGGWQSSAQFYGGTLSLYTTSGPLGTTFTVSPTGGPRNYSLSAYSEVTGDSPTSSYNVHLVDVTANALLIYQSGNTPSVAFAKFGTLLPGHTYGLRATFTGYGSPNSEGNVDFYFGIGQGDFYGNGHPGSNSVVPKLSSFGPAIEGTPLTIQLADALGGANAVILVGQSEADVTLPSGAHLLVGSPNVIPVTLTGSGAGKGGFEATFDIPTGVAGNSAYFQVFVEDPNAVGGYSASQGLKVTFSS
jgi:hypothetical protein